MTTRAHILTAASCVISIPTTIYLIHDWIIEITSRDRFYYMAALVIVCGGIYMFLKSLDYLLSSVKAELINRRKHNEH